MLPSPPTPFTPSTPDYDIVICGAGPVGLCLAALLEKQNAQKNTQSRLLLIDAKTGEQAAQDPRSLALSFGSKQILDAIGAWPLQATAITQIHVSRRGNFGRTLIRSEDFSVPALGYVTRYGQVAEGLTKVCAEIATLRPATVSNITEDATGVTITLSDARTLRSRLLVQAEGGVFGEQTVRARHHDYQQTALVAQVTVSAPIAGRAFERFTEQGPLALLPQDDGYALVWCATKDRIAALQALSDSDFLLALGATFGTRLGKFLSTSARHVFPLGLNAAPMATARTVAIGNAAQTLHPVAGQGLNLGLRDAVVLAQHLAHAKDFSAYVHARRSDRDATIRLTDAMARSFASAADGALSQTLLGAGLGMIDLFAPAKHALAEQMMFGLRP